MNAADTARSLNGKRNGSGWTACCPAHNDRNPSLSIGNGDDGRPLVHCHAGCSQDEVIAVLRDRGDWPTNGDQLSTEREKFHYRIADGATLITVVRRDTPDGKRIHREPKGVKVPAGGYPLYRLGSILANHDKPLLVVEGTAETAVYLFGDRYEVTTAIGGAGKARQTDWTPARSRDVVIWPDADEPGRKHADEVAKLCHQACARSVRIVDTKGLPTGWDLADPINGYDIECAVSDSVPVPYWREPSQKRNRLSRALTMAELYEAPDDDVKWRVRDLLPCGGLSILSARPKAGKSTLARTGAMAVATGQPWLCREVAQAPVLVCAFEEIKAAVVRHYRSMGATPDMPLHFHVGPPPGDPLPWLEEEVERIEPGLVIIDPLFKALNVEDGNNYAEVGRALDPLLALARSSGAHIMAVHHSRKGAGDVAGDEVLGSTSLFAGVDTLLSLKRSTEDDRIISSTQRYGADMEPTLLTLDPVTMWISTAGTRAETAARVTAQHVFDFLANAAEKTPTYEIVDGVDHRRTQVLAALKLLLDEGRIVRSGSGKRNDPHLYAIA